MIINHNLITLNVFLLDCDNQWKCSRSKSFYWDGKAGRYNWICVYTYVIAELFMNWEMCNAIHVMFIFCLVFGIDYRIDILEI